MSLLTQVKLGLVAIGLIVFGYGYRMDDVTMRWFGIAFIAVAFLLRFVGQRRGEKDSAA